MRASRAPVIVEYMPLLLGLVLAVGLWPGLGEGGPPPVLRTLSIRGRAQTIRLYGTRSGQPIIVASGDGGWMHLGPHVARVLAARGYFVIGFDVKAYLTSFTSAATVLRPEDEPGDFQQLVAAARGGSDAKPILVGISEGAGLSVLAAADPALKASVAGVIGLGLPDRNELGWRWQDSMIYLTHGTPSEPMFSTEAIISGVSPLPIVAIQSTHDEFVPADEIQRVMHAACEPKQLWMIAAADHRFSNNLPELDQRLADAIAWVRAHAAS